MTTALCLGLDASGTVPSSDMVASDRSTASLDALRARLPSLRTTTSNAEAAAAPTLFLAVKPHVIPAVLAEIAPALGARPALVISIAAGVTLDALERALPPAARVVRVMPNTPCLVGETASAFALGSRATREDGERVRALLSAVGRAVEVPESYMSAVTGLSGSGPAYVFLFIEALADGGVRAGLPRDKALMLAAQTVLGSAKMVLETGTHPGALKDAVCSAGGTTIAGVHALERGGFRGAAMNAVVAAARRADEMRSKL